MQEGVVGILKDIWNTLKKEIKGPKISSMDISSKEAKILNCDTYDKRVIIINNMENSPKIRDLNESTTDIDVYNGLFKKESSNILLLQSSFQLSQNELVLKKIKNNVKSIKIVEKTTEVNVLELGNKKVNIKEMKIEGIYEEVKSFYIPINCMVYNGNKIMSEIPKKMFGKREYDFTREEFSKILERIKNKLPRKDIYNYKVETIFDGMPIKNIKNIKFFMDKNEIEVYFKENIVECENGEFVMLRNKISGVLEKIFI